MINGAFEGTGVTRHESSSIDEFGLADFFIEGYDARPFNRKYSDGV
jgi:hypothetical protein